MSRLHIIWFGFLLGGVVVGTRLFSIQIVDHSVYLAMAQGQQEFYEDLIPSRGEIFTRDGYPLALNRNWFNVYAVPRDVKDKKVVAREVASILSLDEGEVFSRLDKKDDPYEPLKSKVTDKEVAKLKKFDFPGIRFLSETGRYYPEGGLAAHLLGFVDMEGEGRYGLEGRFNEDLKGDNGFLSGDRDAHGNWVGDGSFEPAKDGGDIVLTIDHLIQFKAEEELKRLVEFYNPSGGSILVLEPDSGRIRAMASYPFFDPNNYQSVDSISSFLNPVVNSQFEPGSVLKVLTMAAAIDDGKITPETTYFDNGSRFIDEYEIKNFDEKSYGEMTMSEVIQKSLNLGAIFASEQMEKKDYLGYLKKFGLGERSGVDLSGELGGDISNLDYEVNVNYATAAFGQGISMTPLQLGMAVGVIANGGALMEPLIFEGDRVREVDRVISPETALSVASMMQGAIEGYSGASVPGFSLAGKTGTAQIAEAGGYADYKWTHSFVGFGPIGDAKFVVLLKLDQPQGVRYATTSLSSSFKNLATFLLGFYKIAPSFQIEEEVLD